MVDVVPVTLVSLVAWILAVMGITWNAWSQTELLLNRDRAPGFYEGCPNCHMISKLTVYRSPGSWCMHVRQHVYLPDPPPPPPPLWRRQLDEVDEVDDPRSLEPDEANKNDVSTTLFDRHFRYTTWENITCAPDAWFFDTCVRHETALYPDGCSVPRAELSRVKKEDVPRECTEEKYKDMYISGVGPWGDCYFPSSDTSKRFGDEYCFPAGVVNPDKPNETCTCMCGTRCKAELAKCEKRWTSEARYNIAKCEAKEKVCHGTDVIYGTAVSGVFFQTVAILPFVAAKFLRNPNMTRAFFKAGYLITALSWILFFSALTAYAVFIRDLNEPRKIFIEQLQLTDLYNFDLYNPVRPNYFTEYLQPNPFTWERYLKGPSYLELETQMEWNWSWQYLSAGWFAILGAMIFQCCVYGIGEFVRRKTMATTSMYDTPPEKAADV